MQGFPSPSDPDAIAATYGVPPGVLDDLLAWRRAGAHDAELRHLLRQADRGGLSDEDARAVVERLPR